MARTALFLLLGLAAMTLAHGTEDHKGHTSDLVLTLTPTSNIPWPTTFKTCEHDGRRKRHGGHHDCDDDSSSSYTGPMFNPSEALSYGPSYGPGPTSKAHYTSKANTTSAATSSSAAPRSSGGSPTTASPTISSGATSSLASPIQVGSTGAAAPTNYAEIIGAVAGGIVAGLALA
ncbi:hypothetical protein K469DRAFT_699620 [Zopfia rhizophila CBS 207.26]|uniref:GPI anchored protein n=1 Tax=Zopfia rhizophila CBS 207.26 TaxID=1314779 RepID=A0A6A6EGS8_9PEZI|nr:hypothetical protein K469DRAFT_699620 [Zopfia rhizophila CBS 207.26]